VMMGIYHSSCYILCLALYCIASMVVGNRRLKRTVASVLNFPYYRFKISGIDDNVFCMC
jgi:hypothetical protein